MKAAGTQKGRLMAEPDGLALAQALAARLCHDLGGPVSSLVTAQEVGGPEAEALARDSVEALRRRLRLVRLLAGAAEDVSTTALEETLDGMLAHGRVRLDASRCAGGDVPAAVTPALLAAILLAAEALPRGGSVVLAGDPGGEMLLLPEGRNAAWPPAVGALFAGGDRPELTPRTVLAHYLRAVAVQAGLSVRLVLGAGPSAALRLARY